MNRLNFLAYVKRTFKRDDKDTEIYEALNDTIKDILGRHQFADYNFQSWVNTTLGQEDYTLPATLLHLRHPIRLIEGFATNNSGKTLKFYTKEEYDELEPNPNRVNPASGEPTGYAVYSNQILLYPIPDKATYIIEINWGEGHTDVELDSDSDEHRFGTHWDEVLKWGTLFRLFAGVGLYEEGEYWRKLYEGTEYGRNGGAVGRMIARESDKAAAGITNITNNSL